MRIIITTMSMDAGGAEMHVYEIAKELASRGYEIMLISSGGRLADRLSSNHPLITVKKLILDKKSPFLLVSLLKLLYYILSFKPHLIHSHGRIPSAVSNITAKISRLPLVATAHGVYKIFPGVSFLSSWGTKTTAVSDDIANYLILNYKIKKENIYIQKNGIDISKFRKLSGSEYEVKRREVLDYLNIEEDKKIILSVSRLSSDAYHCVYELLEASTSLSERLKDSVLLIVGGGELLDDVKRQAAVINQSLDRDFIIILDHRDDIENFMTIADVFIGSARCAIEAAACGCPVIIAGGGNYLGRLTKSTFDECIETNFTARKRNGFDISKMVKDITSAKRGGFEDVMVEYINNNYSVRASCDSLLTAYNSAMRVKGKIKCSILGYYGCGNFGDDMLLSVISNNLRQKMPYLCIAASAGNSRLTNIKNVHFFQRYNPISILHSLASSKIIILGGGELLQDTTSSRSFYYYYLILRVASLLKKKIVLYSNGIGILNKKKNIKRMANLQNNIYLAILRDDGSYKRLYDYMPKFSGISYLSSDECVTIKNVSKTMSADRHRNNFCFIPKNIDGCQYDVFFRGMKKFIDDYSLNPIVIVADSIEDKEISKKSADALGGAKIVNASDIKELFNILSNSAVVVSSRLHGLIFSAITGTAPIAISNDNKIIEFMKQIEQGRYVMSPSEVSELNVINMLHNAFSDRLERNIITENALIVLKQITEKNSDLCVEQIKEAYQLNRNENL